MANLTIKEQPGSYSFSKSPIMYAVLSTDYAYDDFEYTADVYLWQGDVTSVPATASYSLAKPRNATTGAATFDISSLMSDYFLNIPVSFTTPDDTSEMVVHCVVKFGYTYTDGAGAAQEETDVATSNTTTALNGFTLYSEGINAELTDYYGNQTDNYFLTSRPLISYIPNDSKIFMGMIYDTGQDVAKIKYNIVSSSGTETVYLDLTSYDEGLIEFGVGVEQLPTHTTLNANITRIDVTGVDASNVDITHTYKFYIQAGCKYGYKNIQFLNRFGVWDSMIFRGARQDTFETDREQTMLTPLSLDSSSEFSFNQSKGQYHNYVNNSTETFTLNTGFVNEDWNNILRELMTSEQIFDADTLEPYVIETNSLTMQAAINDKVINYALDFKKAFTYINTVN